MNLTPEMRRAMERKPVFLDPTNPPKNQRLANTIYANADTENNGQIAKLERTACDEPLATGKGEKEASGRVHFKFISVRKRLIDPDNVSVKWLLDCCRRIGLVAGDEHDKVTIETAQRKAEKAEEEHTIIEITRP